MSEPPKAVFLSYASQDAEAAKKICDALRTSGIEVWFDQNELVGGDAWDAKIRQQIAECALFVPVISAATQARREGYFRLEWRLAAQRTHMMSEQVAFLLPLVIDATPDAQADVPTEFKAVQWTRLAGGEHAESFCTRVRQLLDGGPAGEPNRPLAAKSRGNSAVPARATVIRRIPLAGWLALVAALAVFGWWKFSPSGTAATPRDPELQRAAALFDFNSPDSTAEGYALAEDILKSVLARRPADVDAVILYAWLNDLFLIRGFDTTEARRVLARQFTERAVKLAPRNPDALAAQGTFYGNGTGHDSARGETLLRQAIALNGRDPRYYRMLSFTLLYQGKRDDALKNARHALTLFPRDCLVHYDYGLLQLYLGDYDGAEKAFRESLTLTPPASLLYAGLHADLASFAAFAHADLAAMKDWLDRMPEAYRDHDREMMPRFIHAAASGDVAPALAILQSMTGTWVRNYGEFPRALLAGDLLLQAGRAEEARIQFEAALAAVTEARAREPAKVRFRVLELWALYRLGRVAEARAALPHVVEAFTQTIFDPLYPDEYWYGPFTLSLVLGDKDTALAFLRRVKTPGWRRYVHNLMQIDPRVKPWRADPAIAAILAEPERPAEKSVVTDQVTAPKDSPRSGAPRASPRLAETMRRVGFRESYPRAQTTLPQLTAPAAGR